MITIPSQDLVSKITKLSRLLVSMITIPSLLLTSLPAIRGQAAILASCVQPLSCTDRQFCDAQGRLTQFRSNKLSFSSDNRGLQVRGEYPEVSSCKRGSKDNLVSLQ